MTAKTAAVERTLRFIVTLGRGPKGPDVFVSVADPRESGGVEVMAWKRGAGGFNYYRSTGKPAMWMFAGNSRDALRPKSRGKGPFEGHPSGSLLMNELKLPCRTGIPRGQHPRDGVRPRRLAPPARVVHHEGSRRRLHLRARRGERGPRSRAGLAEERRQVFKKTMPIAEFPLLLPQTNITATGRRLRRDGTVGTG